MANDLTPPSVSPDFVQRQEQKFGMTEGKTGTEADPSVAKPAEPEVRKAQPPTLEAEIQTKELSALEQEIKFRRQAMIDEQMHAREQQDANMKMKELLSRPLPKMPSYQELYGNVGQQPPSQNQQNVALNVGAYLATALALAFAFNRRGPAAWGAIRGIGEGLQSIQQGNKERANEAVKLWKEQNDLAIKMGETKLQYYKDVMENRKTDLSEKKELLKAGADHWGDTAKSDALQADDWDKTVKSLEAQEKILASSKRERWKKEADFFKLMDADKEHKAYRSYLLDKDEALRNALRDQDPDRAQAEYDRAVKEHPFGEFLKEYDKRKTKETAAGDKEAYARRFPSARDKEYVAVLINRTRDSAQRKALMSPAGSDEFEQAYEQASKAYSRQQFEHDYPEKGALPGPGDTGSMSDEQRQRLLEQAKRLRGGG